MTTQPEITRYDLVPMGDRVHPKFDFVEGGKFMLVADHESALSYWKAYAEECLETCAEMTEAKAKAESALASRDERIAELERARNFHAEQADIAAKGRMRAELELSALRASMLALAKEREELAAHAKATHEKTSSETNRAESWVAWQINQSIAAELTKAVEK